MRMMSDAERYLLSRQRKRVGKTTFERLKEKLDAISPGSDFYDFERLYPGHWQRSAGAWVWMCRERASGPFAFGSRWTASDLLKRTKLVFDGDEICPDDSNLAAEEVKR